MMSHVGFARQVSPKWMVMMGRKDEFSLRTFFNVGEGLMRVVLNVPPPLRCLMPITLHREHVPIERTGGLFDERVRIRGISV